MRIYSKLLLIVCSCFALSCSNEEELFFDKSSAERLSESKVAATEYLCAQPKGWVMEYFPNSTSTGVVFLVKFDKNGSCVIGAKNTYQKEFATSTSLFEMIADNGPVLTFNTYNPLLHVFSNPQAPGTSEADGKGLEGDYEFIVLRTNEEGAWLKGKKHGAYIRLLPYTSELEWDAYFAGIDAMSKRLFSTDALFPLTYTKGETVVKAYSGNSGIFNIVEQGKDIEEGEPLPFIVLIDGIRIYTGGMVTDGTIYMPKEDNSQLVCSVNGESDYFTGPVANQFFAEKITYQWKSDTTAFNQPVKAALQQFRQKLLSPSIYRGLMKIISVEFSSAVFQGNLKRALVIRLKQGKDEYLLPIRMNLEAAGQNQVTIDFPEPLDYSSNSVGAAFLKLGIDEFLLLPPLLKGTYNVASLNGFILRDMQLSGPETISLTR